MPSPLSLQVASFTVGCFATTTGATHQHPIGGAVAGPVITAGIDAVLDEVDRIRRVAGKNAWLSLTEMRGNMGVDKVPNPKAYERANYMIMIQSWEGA